MKVLILAYEPEEEFARRDDQATDQAAFGAYMAPWKVYSESLNAAEVIAAGAPLEKPHTATVISVRDGDRHVQDGPYLDSKNQLGGYFLLDVLDMETATEWAAKCPAAATGHAEVCVIPDYGQEG